MAEQPAKTAAPPAAAAEREPARKATGPEMVTVRLSHRPDEDVKVPKAELPSLRQQGLLALDPEAKEAAK
jgi:hypothetical protein